MSVVFPALLTAFVVHAAAVLPPPAGSKDPKSLAGLVKALNLSQERVNADLMTYKGVLSKLEAAKEIMKASAARMLMGESVSMAG